MMVSGWKPVTGLTWTIGKNISGTGTRNDAAYAAYSSAVFAPGATIKRTGPQTDGDGVNLSCFVHEYKGDGTPSQANWLRRTSVASGGSVTVQSDCTNWRFNFAYVSSACKTMTQTVIDNYFAAEYK